MVVFMLDLALPIFWNVLYLVVVLICGIINIDGLKQMQTLKYAVIVA